MGDQSSSIPQPRDSQDDARRGGAARDDGSTRSGQTFGSNRSRNSRGYVTKSVREPRRDDGRGNRGEYSRDVRDRDYRDRRDRDYRGNSQRGGSGRDFRPHSHSADDSNFGSDGHYGPSDRDSRDHSRSRGRSNPRFQRSDGSNVPGRYGRESPRRSRSGSHPRNRDLRVRRGRSHSHGSPSPGRRSNRPEREWPPCFDEDGTAFVFDPRSAMFYESESDFFYDPKSKLYYGNKKGAYFRYDEAADPPFAKVDSPAKDASSGTSTTEPALTFDASVTGDPAASSKPSIAIKLKTKKLGKKKADVPKPEPVVPKIKKEQVANIEKWKEKQAELKEQTTEPTSSAEPPSEQPVKLTAKGEPICVICKRKFPTIDKLRLHERASALHKQNLEKLALANNEKKRKEPPEAEYQDRAQKRRDMHGPSDQAPVNPTQAPAQRRVETVSPADTLGKDNVGNQMLQKLGWDAEASQGNRGSAAESIRKHWEEIEAKAGARRGPP